MSGGSTINLKESITTPTNYLVDEVPGRDLVGPRICNTENVQDKVVGITLRRRDRFKPDVVWGRSSRSAFGPCEDASW
jgi:hypothetical protein